MEWKLLMIMGIAAMGKKTGMALIVMIWENAYVCLYGMEMEHGHTL